MPFQPIKYYQSGSFVVGNRLLDPEQRSVQADLGRTLTYLADEDRAGRRAGRAAGLAAAREAFYRGDVAATIARYHAAEGGLLTQDDLETNVRALGLEQFKVFQTPVRDLEERSGLMFAELAAADTLGARERGAPRARLIRGPDDVVAE